MKTRTWKNLRRLVLNCAAGQLRDATTGRCGPGVGVNIPRKEMPQIRGTDLEAFVVYARGGGTPITEEQIIADDLSPTQREFRQERIDAIPDDKLKDPILISRDDYVLDGTHRWIKQWQANKWAKVNVLRIDLDLYHALKLMRAFPKTVYAENSFCPTGEQDERQSVIESLKQSWSFKRPLQVHEGEVQPTSPSKKLTKNIRRNPLKYDPTRTVTLRRAFRSKLHRQFSALKVAVMKLVGDEDAFGLRMTRNVFCATGEGGGVDLSCSPKAREVPPRLTSNTRWQYESNPDAVAKFQEWLKTQIKATVRSRTMDQLWDAYIQAGFKKGVARSFDDYSRTKPDWGEKLDFYAGSRKQFLDSSFRQPVSRDKVKLLAGRTFDELENVTKDMSTKMSRVLIDGLIAGKGRREVADDLVRVVGLVETRANTIAQTELIRAHAEGQLVSLDQLGVEELGVMVEWSTAGDSAVCDECQPLEGVVLKMDEAQGMIPRHPNCRCAWMPANVGEDKSDQTRTKSDIGAAIKESRGKDDDWGPGKAISKDRPVSQVKNRRPEPTWEEAQEEDEWRRNGGPLDSLDHLSRFLTDNAFCPTGEGGGVDPTCSPGRSQDVDISDGEGHFKVMDRSAGALYSRWNVDKVTIDELNREEGIKPGPGRDPRESFVYSAIRKWQGSSGGPVATEIVRGALMHAGFDHSGIRKSEGSDKWFQEHPNVRAALHDLGKEMYQATQEWLSGKGVTELTLYRKGSIDRPFSSWTTKPGRIRQEAAGEIVSHKVPASHILSVPATGFGSGDEHEVVVLGGWNKR